MSALTDYFTSLANKIRSKTGGSGTYTPAEMVSDGIDDVYDAGVAAGGGGTPITPDNDVPVALTANTSVKPTKAGYAIESYRSITPGNTPTDLTYKNIYRIAGSDGGKVVKTITEVYPSNSSPVALTLGLICQILGSTAGTVGYAIASYNENNLSDTSAVSLATDKMYKFKDAGYAIKKYTTVTASDSNPPSMSLYNFYRCNSGVGYLVATSPTSVTPTTSGASFSSGLKYMSSSGYAYSSKPSMSTTTLWTNSSGSSGFAAQTISLSQAITNFDYIEIVFRRNTSDSTCNSVIVKSSEAKNCTSISSGNSCYAMNYAGSWNCCRRFFFPTTSQIQFTTGNQVNGTNTSNNNVIPQKVYGLKLP